MTRAEYSSLKYLNRINFPLWEKTSFLVAKKLDNSIPTIGNIRITSTWRAKNGAGATNSLHKRNPSLAIDFVPANPSLWSIFRKLRALAWHRIGIQPAAHLLHVDVGHETGVKPGDYFFYEPSGGSDGGPIEKQKLSLLQEIPGFDGNFSALGTTVQTAIASTMGVEKTPEGKTILDPKLLIPLAFAAGRLFIG